MYQPYEKKNLSDSKTKKYRRDTSVYAHKIRMNDYVHITVLS